MNPATTRTLSTLATILMLFTGMSKNLDAQPECIVNEGVTYDLSFAVNAIRYLDTGDSAWLRKASETPAADHLVRHAGWSGSDIPHANTLELTAYLLTSIGKDRSNLPLIIRNLQYVRDSIIATGYPKRICSLYLPSSFRFADTLFFTCGYDLGVVYGRNASLNIAHPKYLESIKEMKYYSVHELHHGAFVGLKGGTLPSLGIHTRGEMANLIRFLTQMEGMAVYAALDARKNDHAMAGDGDYVALYDSVRMRRYKEDFFAIFSHFSEHPEDSLTQADWEKLGPLSGGDRLWYRVGAAMAMTIDKLKGREYLTGLIAQEADRFFNEYVQLTISATE